MSNEPKTTRTSMKEELVKSFLKDGMSTNEIREVFKENDIKLNKEIETILNSVEISKLS